MASEEIKKALMESGLRFKILDATGVPDEQGPSQPACQVGTPTTSGCTGGCQYGCYYTGCYAVQCAFDQCIGVTCSQGRCVSVGGCWNWIATFT